MKDLFTVLRLTASSRDMKERGWIVGFGISEELRCSYYVIGKSEILFLLRNGKIRDFIPTA
jgi:hypothetical protein